MFNAILTGVPDWSLLPAGTSKELRYLLRGCLERDPGRRFPDGASLRREIERIKGSSDHSNQNKKNRWRYAAVVAVLTLVVIATVRYMRQPQSLQVEDTRQLTLAAGLELDPSLSPDGERLAYALRKLLYIGSVLYRFAQGELIDRKTVDLLKQLQVS